MRQVDVFESEITGELLEQSGLRVEASRQRVGDAPPLRQLGGIEAKPLAEPAQRLRPTFGSSAATSSPRRMFQRAMTLV